MRKLEKLADEALGQIRDKRYSTEMTEIGIEEIIRFGIAFSGKRVVVKTE